MKKKLTALIAAPALLLSMAACSSGDSDDGGVDVNRVRVVLGSSSTTADTYQSAHAFTENVGKELDVNMKADAVGRNQAYQALEKAKGDGSTILFFHDSGYLAVMYGALPEKYSLENFTVGPVISLNPGAAFLAKHDAPYDDLAEAAEWLSENESETLSFAVEPGGSSELALDAFYIWATEKYGDDLGDRIEVFATGSDEEKNQALWAGNTDIIFGSVTGNEQYTGDDVETKVREKFLALTASEPLEGYDIPTYTELGIEVNGEPYAFDKEFYALMPKDIDEGYASALDEATGQAIESDAYRDELSKNMLEPNYIPMSESTDYLMDKQERLQAIVDQAPDIADLTK